MEQANLALEDAAGMGASEEDGCEHAGKVALKHKRSSRAL